CSSDLSLGTAVRSVGERHSGGHDRGGGAVAIFRPILGDDRLCAGASRGGARGGSLAARLFRFGARASPSSAGSGGGSGEERSLPGARAIRRIRQFAPGGRSGKGRGGARAFAGRTSARPARASGAP